MGPSQFDHEKRDVYRLELNLLFCNELNAARQCWFAPWLCLPNCWSVLILNNSGVRESPSDPVLPFEHEYSGRRGLFWVRHEQIGGLGAFAAPSA
jgi:hypothetical protein